MNFLNNGTGYKLFAEAALCDTYVDKTMMIDTLYRYVCAGNKYICVTRPRRFGKSVNANMIAAFFDKSTGEESRELFQQLALGMLQPEQDKCFAANPRGTEERKLCWPRRQGKLNVIRINMIDVLFDTVQSFAALHSKLAFLLREDLQHQYPDLTFPAEKDLPELLMQTGESFVFVIDEWDAFFETPSVTESDKQQYLLFLKGLLKDKPYVHLVYMTGILPIAKNPSGSPLNMFHEFSAFQDDQFYAYFGFTREEIQDLMQRKGYTQPSLEELLFWYDGYARSNDGVHMFNPVAVSRALIDKKCRSYWTETGPMNEIRDMIHSNIHDL